MRRTLLGLISVLVLAACGGGAADGTSGVRPSGSGGVSSSAPTATSDPPMSAPPTEAAGRTITTRKSRFGTVLFDGRGRVVYLFEKETSTTARCYGDCAAAWPPVLTSGTPQAAGRANASLLGTTTRRDGSTQVTYAGHPLYYYVHDGVGEILCHDVVEFGGLWLVVTPSGRAAG